MQMSILCYARNIFIFMANLHAYVTLHLVMTHHTTCGMLLFNVKIKLLIINPEGSLQYFFTKINVSENIQNLFWKKCYTRLL